MSSCWWDLPHIPWDQPCIPFIYWLKFFSKERTTFNLKPKICTHIRQDLALLLETMSHCCSSSSFFFSSFFLFLFEISLTFLEHMVWPKLVGSEHTYKPPQDTLSVVLRTLYSAVTVFGLLWSNCCASSLQPSRWKADVCWHKKKLLPLNGLCHGRCSI